MLKFLTIIPVLVVCSVVAAESPVRTEALEHIKNYINDSVDPCDNFFQFACGKWKNYNKIAEDKFIINGHILLAKQIFGEIKGLLEQDTPIFNAEVELKVKEFYKSCLNTDLIQKKGYEPLLKFIKSVGGMPVLDKEWDETKFDWIKVESLLQSYGFDGVMRAKVLKSETEGSNIFVGEIGLPLAKESYDQKSFIDEYTQKIVKIFVDKFNVDAVIAEKVAAEIVEFEKNLVKGVSDESLRHSMEKYFVPSKIEDLQTKYPAVEWEKFLTESFGVPIEKSKIITEIGPAYVGNLIELIKNTPKPVVANFMMWNAVRQFLNVTVPEEQQTFERVTYCIRKTQQYFPKEIGYMYSLKYYNNDIKEDIESMVELIKKEIHSAFEKYDWIDDETKKIAYQRLETLKVALIAYPKGSQMTIDDNFKKVVINQEEYYLNLINILQYNYKNFATKVLTNSKIEDLYEDPTGIQSYYNAYENVLKISLAFLKAPFYTNTLPKNMKFAQIGAVMVHEIFHAFDTVGQGIDLKGKPNKWWADKATDLYNEKAKCFAAQYGQYQHGNPDVNDNIADNGGIKYAFKTYQNWANDAKDTKKELYELETFPGLDYTNTQLFFITHAQTWCHAAKGSDDGDFVYPVEYRINLPMRNFDGFAKEFKCPEGSLMNPKEKCLLW